MCHFTNMEIIQKGRGMKGQWYGGVDNDLDKEKMTCHGYAVSSVVNGRSQHRTNSNLGQFHG